MRYVRVLVLVVAALSASATACEATGPLYDPGGMTAN